MTPELSFADNGAGWRIALRRTDPPESSRPRRPVLIVPGYGMNSFIFGFHPRGLSLEAYIASRGFEVWSADLRAQGRSERREGDPAADRPFGLGELAVEDVGTAIGHVLRETRTGHEQIDLVGVSLGASIVFAHLACVPGVPVGSVVSMGGLVTWTKVPILLRALFFSPQIAGAIRMTRTRKLAGFALPTLARFAPGVLSIYLHTRSTDIADVATMVQTVEDPIPLINREIAEWVARKELVVRGINVSRALSSMRFPLLCVVANQDGIVPPETSRAPYDEIGSTDKVLLTVGDEHQPIAHADLFLSTGAQERIFAKIADFLDAR
jgi:pimeloyl-ACP methyl ester carboxylesterase